MRLGSIYRLRNRITRKVYVGQTIKPPEKRWTSHRLDASKGKQQKLYRSMRKHGVENFELQVVLSNIPEDCLNCCEIVFIALHDSLRNGYNANIGGNSNRGYKHSEEVLARLRGRIFSQETLEKIRAHRHTEETKQRISATKTGVPRPLETRRAPGWKHTPEALAKMSAAKKGKPGNSKGVPCSEQKRQKISAALKLRNVQLRLTVPQSASTPLPPSLR